MDFKIEVCVGSATQALEAQKNGADRVELCSALSEGGITPSYGEMSQARKLLDVTKLHVIIRPRRGDFLYSSIEMNSMLADIELAKNIGVDGVVIGCLKQNGDIDMLKTKTLISAAEGLSITFHRAFDMCRCRTDALEQLIDLGCNRVLTSGGKISAEVGAGHLRSLVEQAGKRIIIMPGCGINPQNIASIARTTQASEFHFSANRLHPGNMEYRNDIVSMGGENGIDEYSIAVTDNDKIKNIRQILSSL